MLARDADFTIDTSSIFDVNLTRQTQSQLHIPTANMVVYYSLPVVGKVGSHYLAIGVLSTMFGGIALLSGGSSKAVQQSPPIKASSRGEEDFIQKFLKDAEGEKKH